MATVATFVSAQDEEVADEEIDTIEEEIDETIKNFPLTGMQTVLTVIITAFISGAIYYVLNHNKMNGPVKSQVEESINAEGGAKEGKFVRVWITQSLSVSEKRIIDDVLKNARWSNEKIKF